MNKIIPIMVVTMLFVCTLTACVKLQMPDDIISDTVDVIKGDDDARNVGSVANTFTHSVVGTSNSSVAELTKSCFSELEARAQTLLGNSELSFTVISENVSILGDKAIVNCAASIE